MSTSPGSPDRLWSHRRFIPRANSLAAALQTMTRLAAGLSTVASATASWAGTALDCWCKRLDSFLDRPDIKPVFEKYFIPVKLAVQENARNKALENPVLKSGDRD